MSVSGDTLFPAEEFQMRKHIGALIAVVLTAAGCASTQVSTTWNNPAKAGVRPSKVLVVASVPTIAVRNSLERDLTAKLGDLGIQAVPLSRIDPSDRPVSRDRIN